MAKRAVLLSHAEFSYVVYYQLRLQSLKSITPHCLDIEPHKWLRRSPS